MLPNEMHVPLLTNRYIVYDCICMLWPLKEILYKSINITTQ